jgi:wyosine [tRNA(Phe)-imidazoG37] synthetase (radical SAM superfamily)
MSLGISLTPPKACTFDCIYCQLGKTNNLTILRLEYVKLGQIIEEISECLASYGKDLSALDYITISGSGEPTLNTRIADLISHLKTLFPVKIAVITNSSFLPDASVRQEILGRI